MRITFESGEYLNITAKCVEVGVPFPNSENEGRHCKFRFTITNPVTKQRMTSTFYDSEYNYYQNKHEMDEDMARSMINCVVSDAECYDCSRDLEDFCSNFGYNPYDIRAHRIYKACKLMSEKVERVFDGLSGETMEEIRNY